MSVGISTFAAGTAAEIADLQAIRRSFSDLRSPGRIWKKDVLAFGRGGIV